MIDGVHEGLPQGRQRVADPGTRLSPASLLLQMGNGEALKIVQTGAKLFRKRALEDPFLLHVAAAVRRKLHGFDPGAPKPSGRIPREKQKAPVPGHFVIADPGRDPHASIDLGGRRFIDEPAPYLAQVLANRCPAQVLQPGVLRPPVVPRDAGRLRDELSKQPAPLFGVDRLRTQTNPVSARAGAVSGRAVRSRVARRRPGNQDKAVADRLGRQNGLIHSRHSDCDGRWQRRRSPGAPAVRSLPGPTTPRTPAVPTPPRGMREGCRR